MQSEIIVICDTDERYAALLAEYINSREHSPLLAEPFSDESSARQYVSQRKAQIVLLGSGICDTPEVLERWKEECAGKDHLLICLTAQIGQNPEGLPGLRKYQAADQLLRAVLELYALHSPGASVSERKEMTRAGGAISYGEDRKIDLRKEDSLQERPAVWDKSSSILGVYSPIGRCGKTSFAIVLGEMLAFREHVLYVNLEDYSGFSHLMESGGEGDLSDLLYFSRVPGGQLIYKLESMVQTWERLDYILPASYANDLQEISMNEWKAFFSRLSTEGDYDHIVLDIGSGRGDAGPLLGMCERVYVPMLEDPVSTAKLKQFTENAAHMYGALPEDKIVYLHLPEPGKLESNTQIPFPQRLVRGKMGTYVKKLIAREELPGSGRKTGGLNG